MTVDSALLSGRYRLGEVIGTGGMAVVYQATDTLLGRDVAVKMMRPDLARDDSFLERFRREALNIAKLNHHAIVAVYDTGVTDTPTGEVPYIVMELVHGETLRGIIRADGPMDPRRAATIMADVCSALQFSHEAGIIHRDIKPANIMITGTGAVKVMDFGIARAANDNSNSMTRTASVIGTAQYLSPEQARGKSADRRSDIYSVGCVLYEALTGRPPFTGETPLSVAYQHVEDAPVPPSERLGTEADTPALDLDTVVLTAMAKSPDDRYATAEDLRQDLLRIVSGEAPLGAGPHVAGLTTQMANQQAATRTVTARPGVPMPPGDVLPRSLDPAAREARASSATRTPGTSKQRRRRTSPWLIAVWTLVILALVGTGGYLGWNMLGQKEEDQALPPAPVPAEPQLVTLPDVAGRTASAARTLLAEAGLTVVEEERSDPEVPRGQAIGTEPAPGSQVQAGSSVTLFISTGKEVTEVPDLRGHTTEEAAAILRAAGLDLDTVVKEESSTTVTAGRIIEQAPSGGSQVSKGTKVTITVSIGPQQVRVPVVSGQVLATARGNLESAGFTVNVVAVDHTAPADTVIQVSGEGTQLDFGSTVTVQVSRGNQFTVPNLVNLTATDALAALAQQGWTGAEVRRPVDTNDLTRVDRVVDQNPQPGQIAYKDQTIELGVYEFALIPTRR